MAWKGEISFTCIWKCFTTKQKKELSAQLIRAVFGCVFCEVKMIYIDDCLFVNNAGGKILIRNSKMSYIFAWR